MSKKDRYAYTVEQVLDFMTTTIYAGSQLNAAKGFAEKVVDETHPSVATYLVYWKNGKFQRKEQF